MRIYYAHAKCIYGTSRERQEKKCIRTCFPNCAMVNPSRYEAEFSKSGLGMDYWFGHIDRCDSLIYSRLMGRVTAGVGEEIRYALSARKAVYELEKGKARRIRRPVKHVSIDETLHLFQIWRSRRSK